MKKILLFLSFVIGLFLSLGIANRVEATNFILADGTTSDITYNEGQLLSPSDNPYMTTFRIIYSNNYYAILMSTNESLVMYNNCTYDSNSSTLSCTKIITSMSPNSTNAGFIFSNNYNFTIDSNKITALPVMGSSISTDYFIVPSYQDGYNDGIGDNQETIYNNGYNEGYNDGYNDGYNIGYTEGQDSIDIEVENQKAITMFIHNNGYKSPTEVEAIEETAYNNGYYQGRLDLVNELNRLVSQNPFLNSLNENINDESEDFFTRLVNLDYLDCYGVYNISPNPNEFVYLYIPNLTKIYHLSYVESNNALVDFWSNYVNSSQDEKYEDLDLSNMVLSSNVTNDYITNVPITYLDVNAIYDYAIDYGWLMGNDYGFNEGKANGIEEGFNQGYANAYNKYGTDESLADMPIKLLGGIGAFIMPIITYEIFGISVLSVLAIFLVIGLLYFVIKFLRN